MSESTEKDGIDWKSERRGLLLLLAAVLLFHTFIAKPFYIPSPSMMPVLIKGDRLIVSKYPYGWSWISASFHILPPFPGKLLGELPEYGDIAILSPVGSTDDYIKRVVGLPGDTLEVRGGQIILNGTPVRQEVQPDLILPVDDNVPCTAPLMVGRRFQGNDGELYCRLPILRETLPNGTQYDIIDLTPNNPLDNRDPITIPEGHVFLMGDNRDMSADSRAIGPLQGGIGLGGPVPVENIGGRAEFTTFSIDGTASWNPFSWFGALRGDRAFLSLRPERAPEAAE